MTRIGIVTGMVSESRCLSPQSRGGQAQVRTVGADAGRATAAARDLLTAGCEGLVSFGMAGGLVRGLLPGQVILARRILGPSGGVLSVSLAWRDRLRVLLSGGFEVMDGDIVGSERLVDSAAAKAALHAATGAAAVDMESLAVASVAAAAAVPFVAVRAIADAAGRAPPAWALATLKSDGSVDLPAALRMLLAKPSALPDALAMARDSRAALASLRRVALRAGPVFGLR